MKIFMVLDTLDYGDGVSSDCLMKAEMCRELGYICEIYAIHCDERLREMCHAFDDIVPMFDDVIIHHFTGYSEVAAMLTNMQGIKVMIYHNITPPEFVDDKIKVFCEKGIRQLETLSYDYYVGDSDYNLNNLYRHGIRKIGRKLPIVVDDSQYNGKQEKTISAIITQKHKPKEAVRMLFVGRLVGNKCVEDILKVFFYYYDQIDKNVTLDIVGNEDQSPDYVAMLKSMVHQFKGKDHVTFHGKVSDEEKTRLFNRANYYISMSEHEGFCIPLLEAMTKDLITVAYKSSAIEETMGDSGILVSDKNPMFVASAIATVHKNMEIKEKIIQAQRKNLKRYSHECIKEGLADILDDIIAGRNWEKKNESNDLKIQMQGPFETSYSLALVNRKLIESLSKRKDVNASIHCEEGPGNYWPADEDLIDIPYARRLWRKEVTFGIADVGIRNMFPPVTKRLTGRLNFQSFGWEEDRVPAEYIRGFNSDLDGIGTTSDFVTEALINSGLSIPVRTIGNGVDLPIDYNKYSPYTLKTRKKYKFLNISSAFPRKGIDILLDAYFECFTKEDDVCLVLKTFPNIHNKTGEQIDQLKKKYVKAPEVEWIDKDLTEEKLYGLYKAVDCYVQTSRGEGFGLPVAEAMLAEVPVVCCNNSGMADFCNENTCFTVGFTKGEAHSHLSEKSNWFEPNREDLKKHMEWMVYQRDEAIIKEKTKKAKELIERKFNWDVVANRWMNFINDVRKNAQGICVAMVTTWNTRCGIAEYTKYLVESMHTDVKYTIYPNIGDPIEREDEEFVAERTWKKREDICNLIHVLNESDADIVHIQFAWGFFKANQLTDILKCVHKRIIVQIHGTDQFVDEVLSDPMSEQLIKELRLASCYLVHQADDLVKLQKVNLGVDKVKLYSLPQRSFIQRSVSVARQELGIALDCQIVAAYGFLDPHKSIYELIQAIEKLREKYPNILLMAVCAIYSPEVSGEYYEKCLAYVREHHLSENVYIITDFLEPEESVLLLQTADVLCLPYAPSKESASGAARFCVGAGRPLIVTDQPIFAEFKGQSLQIKDNSPQKIASAIENVLMMEDTSKYIVQDDTEKSFHTISRKIYSLYKELLKDIEVV